MRVPQRRGGEKGRQRSGLVTPRAAAPGSEQEARSRSAVADLFATSSRRRVLVAVLVDTVGTGMFSSLLLLYLSRVNEIPASTAGPTVTISALASFALMPVVSKCVHKLGGRGALIACSASSAAGYLFIFVAHSPALVLTASLMTAMGDRLHGAAWPILAAEQFGRQRLSFLFAVMNSAKTVALGIGTLTSALALATDSSSGLQIALGANVASYMLGLAFLLGVRPIEGHAARKPDHQPLSTALKNKRFMQLVISQTALSASWIIPGVAFPLYLTDNLGEAPALAAIMLTIRYAVISTVQVPIMRYAQNWSRRRVLAISAASAVLGVVCVDLLPQASGPWRVVVASTATALLAGSEIVSKPTASARAVHHAPEGGEAPYMAVFQVTWTLSYAVGPAAIGLGLENPPVLWGSILAIITIGTLTGGVISKRCVTEPEIS
ncbi:MFS transporter [Streptomyces olivaceoviridis]|uniref:MFS transporter n=1 Tax=Streptomyces olivaceoviridis TaxID=1921 RepID=UPI0036F96AAC